MKLKAKGQNYMSAKVVHSMIRVLEEQRSVKFYQDAFGLNIADRFDFDDFTLIYLSNEKSHFELELTVNKGRTDPYDLGDGYGHIAVVVDDLENEHQRFQGLNLDPGKIVEFERDGKPMAKFFFVQDPDGYKIELIQTMGRYT